MNKYIECPDFGGLARIVCAGEHRVRHEATSGGFVTALGRQLFLVGKVKSALTFVFAGEGLYQPRVVYGADDYQPIGSIYHDTQTVSFIRENIESIVSPIFLTCLPCEVKALRVLLAKHHIESIIVSLVCSNQLKKDATYYLLHSSNVNAQAVKMIRYRGNGWPSGVQISTCDEELFFPNNGSRWMGIFHSHIFSMERCYGCADTFGLQADFIVADPWLERYVKNDSEGATVVIPRNERAMHLFYSLEKDGVINTIEMISDDEVIQSQRYTLNKKAFYRRNRKLMRFLLTVVRSNIYRALVRRPYLLAIHTKLLNKSIKIISKVF